uniref:Uncharacterized protein n=1 Tax=Kalanchoe fedtschenkoi TaxID=63787 RepID=A0A7N0VC14_KALFE
MKRGKSSGLEFDRCVETKEGDEEERLAETTVGGATAGKLKLGGDEAYFCVSFTNSTIITSFLQFQIFSSLPSTPLLFSWTSLLHWLFKQCLIDSYQSEAMSSYTPRNILITGAAGFIASHKDKETIRLRGVVGSVCDKIASLCIQEP